MTFAMGFFLTSDFSEINAVDKGGQTVLHVPASAGLREVCLTLLSRHGFSKISAVDADDNSTLHLGVRARLTYVCQAILARNSFTKVNARDAPDKTSLHLAAAGSPKSARQCCNSTILWQLVLAIAEDKQLLNMSRSMEIGP